VDRALARGEYRWWGRDLDLVVFSSYEVIERAPYLGESRAWIGEPTWKTLDRITVEVLVGGKV